MTPQTHYIVPEKLQFWGWVLVALFAVGLALYGAAYVWPVPYWLSAAGGFVAAGTIAVGAGLSKLGDEPGPRVELSVEGLSAMAWGTGPVPWADIEDVGTRGRWVVVCLKDPDAWLARAGGAQAFFMKLFAYVGRGPFAIECTLLDVTAPDLALAIKKRLV